MCCFAPPSCLLFHFLIGAESAKAASQDLETLVLALQHLYHTTDAATQMSGRRARVPSKQWQQPHVRRAAVTAIVPRVISCRLPNRALPARHGKGTRLAPMRRGQKRASSCGKGLVRRPRAAQSAGSGPLAPPSSASPGGRGGGGADPYCASLLNRTRPRHQHRPQCPTVPGIRPWGPARSPGTQGATRGAPEAHACPASVACFARRGYRTLRATERAPAAHGARSQCEFGARRGCRAPRAIEGTHAARVAQLSGWRRKGEEQEPWTNTGWAEPRTTVRGKPPRTSHRCTRHPRPPQRSARNPRRCDDTHGNHAGARNAYVRHTQGWSHWAPRTQQRGKAGGGRPGQHAEGWSIWASRTQKHGEACGGRPECGGEWAAKPVKRPPKQPAQPPVRPPLGSANAETTPARAPAAAANRTQRPDATCEGKNG